MMASVPCNYLCIACGRYADHWIMECKRVDGSIRLDYDRLVELVPMKKEIYAVINKVGKRLGFKCRACETEFDHGGEYCISLTYSDRFSRRGSETEYRMYHLKCYKRSLHWKRHQTPQVIERLTKLKGFDVLSKHDQTELINSLKST